MKHLVTTIRNERGSGLLMAILVLVAIGALAAGLIATMTNDRRVASYDFARGTALDYAEAGVTEALDRIRSGDVPDKRNPRMVSEIFLAPAGSMPSVGTDTTAIPTAQPAGQWLPYTTDTPGPDVLKIQYMTNSARTGIYYYDATKSPPIQGMTGSPVFIISSAGRAGVAKRRVEATVTPSIIQPNLKGALVADDKVKLTGSISAVGYDYVAETPAGTGAGGVNNATYQTNANNAPGVWATGDISIGGSSKAIGVPNTSKLQAGFYSGPWDVLNMTQSQFYDWVGPPQDDVKGNVPLPSGIVYMNHANEKPGNGKHKFVFEGGSGDGLLYVNGDLEIQGDFTFRGLIYVEGQITIKGSGWILGGLVIGDKSKIGASHKESLTIVKSNAAVSQFLGSHKTPFITLGWREQ